MMLKPRTIVLGSMLGLPILIYCCVGLYAIWQVGLIRWIWWLLPVCWTLTWGLSRVWKVNGNRKVEPLSPLSHWTQRDADATQIVRRYQQRVTTVSPEKLADLHFVLDEMKSLASDVSQHYHPKTLTPIDSLTLPEVLAASRLAIADIEQWTLETAPGSRLLTIGQWKSLRHAPKWIKRLRDFSWATSILLNPANLGLYLSSKVSIQPVTNELTQDLMMLLYARFVRQVGFYLIEMNSGRLRAGADAYLETFGSVGDGGTAPDSSTGSKPLRSKQSSTVKVALIGQVSSGKSSLINALTGSEAAAVDVLPTTKTVSQHRLEAGGESAYEANVCLLDTPGYGESGADENQLREIRIALQTSDAVLLLVDGHSPAREPDLRTLRDLKAWFTCQPQLRLPPILGLVTHIDLLPPSLEWQPPYDWRRPQREKEKQIAEAIDYTKEVFGDLLANCVPLCLASDSSRQWGLSEEVLPALIRLLQDAQSVATLRAFETRLDSNKMKAILRQLRSLGSSVVAEFTKNRGED